MLNECNRYMLECYLRAHKKELAIEILRNEIDKSSFTYDLCELVLKYETKDLVGALDL